jgi:hypothetical protein
MIPGIMTVQWLIVITIITILCGHCDIMMKTAQLKSRAPKRIEYKKRIEKYMYTYIIGIRISYSKKLFRI